MKEKILLFVTGILIGAVIATGAFYIYSNSNSNKCVNNNTNQMNGEKPPEMPNGQNSENGQPPEKPDGENNNMNQTQSNNNQS